MAEAARAIGAVAFSAVEVLGAFLLLVFWRVPP